MMFGAKEILITGLAALCLCQSVNAYSTTVSPATEQSWTHDTPEELGEENWFQTTAGPRRFGYGKCKPGDSYFDGCNTCVCKFHGRWICTLRDCGLRQSVEQRNEGDTDGDTHEELDIQTTPETWPTPTAAESNGESENKGVSGSPAVPEATVENISSEVPEQFVRVTPIPASEVCKTYEDITKTYFDGCNRCRCFDIGQSACTRKGCPVILVTSRPSTNPTTAAPKEPRTHDTPEELGLQNWFSTTVAPVHEQPKTHVTLEELGIRTTPKTETTASSEVEQPRTHDTPEELGLHNWFSTTVAPVHEQPKTHDTLEELGIRTTPKTETTVSSEVEQPRTHDTPEELGLQKWFSTTVAPVHEQPKTHDTLEELGIRTTPKTETTVSLEVEQPRTHDTPEDLGLQNWFSTTVAPVHEQPKTHDTPEELGIRTTQRPMTQPTTVTSTVEEGMEGESGARISIEPEGKGEGILETFKNDVEPENVIKGITETTKKYVAKDYLSADRSGQFVRVKPIPASVACKKNENIFKMYFDGCNMCRCFDIGQSVCNRKACPVIPRRQLQPPNLPSDLCRAATDIGKQFKDGCNSCWCRNIGHALCTRRDCR